MYLFVLVFKLFFEHIIPIINFKMILYFFKVNYYFYSILLIPNEQRFITNELIPHEKLEIPEIALNPSSAHYRFFFNLFMSIHSISSLHTVLYMYVLYRKCVVNRKNCYQVYEKFCYILVFITCFRGVFMCSIPQSRLER